MDESLHLFTLGNFHLPPLCPRVKLQNRSAVVLNIRAEVVDQRLEVFDLQVIQ